MNVKIGCTGWSHQGWIGPFYPKTMASSDYLRHYSKTFGITEINSTFYKIPSQFTTKKWSLDIPENFVFTAKMPKQITHDARLKPGPYLDQFLTAIKPIGSKMKIIVIQLPPSLSFKEARTNLEKMLNHLQLDIDMQLREGIRRGLLTSQTNSSQTKMSVLYGMRSKVC